MELYKRATGLAFLAYASLPLYGYAAPAAAPASSAEPALTAPAFPRFDIVRFEVVGNTLLDASAIDGIVQPYTGKQKDFGDIEQALEALQQAYAAAGYSAVQVRLPEQDVNNGVVRLLVIEGKVKHILVKGSRFHDKQNVEASVPSLQVGGTPRAKQIEANLRVANENPSKKTQVFLKSTEQPGEIDATLQVADQKPSKFGVVLDNTGTPETGNYRVGVFYQNSNVANRDQVLTMQVMTSPEHLGRAQIFGAGYHVPLYARGDSVDLLAGYTDVNSGVVQNLFNVSGSGSILGAHYNHNLDRHNDYDHKLVYGFDYRAYRNNVKLVGTATSLVPNVTVHPLSVSYVGQWHPPKRYVSFYVSEVANLPGGGQGGSAAFAATRTNARASYMLTRYGVDYTQAYQGDWQSHVSFSGQYTSDALVPGEQFGIGGESSVRGFYERELADDQGYRGSVEFYTPDFGDRFGGNVKERALVFYDFADASRNKALPGEVTHYSIGSVGVGLRASMGDNFSLLADLAEVVDAGGRHAKYDKRLHFSVVMSY